jgi:hypothetical protein
MCRKDKDSTWQLAPYSDRSEEEGEKKRKFMIQKKILQHQPWRLFTVGHDYLGTANKRALNEHEHQPWTITSKERVKDTEADPEPDPEGKLQSL